MFSILTLAILSLYALPFSNCILLVFFQRCLFESQTRVKQCKHRKPKRFNVHGKQIQWKYFLMNKYLNYLKLYLIGNMNMISLSPYIGNETSGDKKEGKECFLCNLYMWVDTHEWFYVSKNICIHRNRISKNVVKTADTLGIAN